MDQPASAGDLVLETLLKTNRPPTDEEKVIIHESMAPTNAKLKVVEEEISDTIAYIQALKSQVERAETKLQRLREQEAAIMETSEDYRRVLSAIRNLPEDVLREICLAFVEDRIPDLSYSEIPLPYVLAQISTGLRHIALTTPSIWARMHVPPYFGAYKKAYTTLARRAIKWFERAGGLPLTLTIWDPSEGDMPDPSDILFDALLSYSAHWKEIEFTSCSEGLSRQLIRMVSLTAIDLPLLGSVSLELGLSIDHTPLQDTGMFRIPTLKSVSLFTDRLRSFAVNWAGLTSLYLNARLDSSCHTMNELAGILQQTKRLRSCNISFAHWNRPGVERYLKKINLPFLETLYITDRTFGPLRPSPEIPSLVDLITDPALEIIGISSIFLKFSFADFLQRSPKVRELSLPYFPEDALFTNTTGFLRHCPSLVDLSLQPVVTKVTCAPSVHLR